MQIKTVRNNITMKMEQWLASITDETLRKDIKSNLLVSGGSITSMLLNEPINDYDVYLKDPGVLVRLLTYYLRLEKLLGEEDDSDGLKIYDGRKKQEYVDDYKKKHGDENLQSNNQYAVALRNLKENQIKIFFTAPGGIKVNESREKDKLDYHLRFVSPNAISLSDNIQVVCRFYGTDEQIHKTFDFIHATNYFTFKDGLVTNLEAVTSILTKQLKYQGSMYPVTSVIRMKKFIKRGWNINAGQILKMCMQISELDLTNPDVLEEQLIGVDVAYFSKLIEILREANISEEKKSAGYINTIIDRVFDSFDGQEE